MKTVVLYSFLTLGIWTVSATDQSNVKVNNLPYLSLYVRPLAIFCVFGGDAMYMHGYKFNVDDLNSLNKCSAFVYSHYYFDRPKINETKFTDQVLEADRNAIQSIVKANRPVYLMVGYMTHWSLWTDLLNATDQAYADNQVDILVSFLSEYKICGIILHNINIYYNYTEPLTDYVIDFTQTIKDKLNTLQVGLYIFGHDYSYFKYEGYFNFTSTNSLIDGYFIDMTDLNSCSPITKKGGVNPIHSNDPTITSIEQVCNAISKSHMEKSKVFATLLIVVTESDEDAKAFKDQIGAESYRQLCLDAVKHTNTTRWCFDTTETLYNQGQFVAGFTGNIMVTDMEFDDFSGACQCGKFIATNTIINGWQRGEKLSCDAFDKLKPAS